MNKIKHLCIPICLALLGVGILFIGAWDMRQVAAAPRPENWLPATSLPEPLAANLVHCPDDPDSFYMVGGVVIDGSTDQLWRYDINASGGSWFERAPMPAPRRAVAAACYQGMIYVAGGWDNWIIYNSFYIYDIIDNEWTVGPNLPSPIWGASMGAWDGKLYVAGGTRINEPWTPIGRVDVFDLASGEWTVAGGQDMPYAASFYAGAQSGQYLYAIGGYTEFSNNVDQTQRYDMVSGEWQLGPEFTSARALGSLAVTNSHLYMLGGDLDGGGAFDFTDQVDMLDLTTWPVGSWIDLADPLPQPNLYAASTCSELMIDGEIWAIGGTDGVIPMANVYYRPSDSCVDFYFGDLPREEWALGNHPGEIAHYVIPLVNNGTITDSYDIDVNSNWVIMAPQSIGPIGAGMTDLLMVNIQVPVDALPGDFDIATLTITSQADPDASDSAMLSTSVTDWQEGASVPGDIGFHSKAQCANDPNGFYILGGGTPDFWAIDEVNYYNAVEDTWTLKTRLPRGGGWGHIAACYDNKLYVLGSGFTSYLDVYDIALNSWTYGLTIAPRDPFAAGMGVWDGELFMVGGTDEVNIYNVNENTWSLGPSMPVEGFGFGYVQAGQYLYVVGGESGDWIGWYDNLDITLRLNMADKVWETGPTFPSRRGLVNLAVSESHLYAIAGDTNGGERLDPTGLVEVLDLTLWPEGDWMDIEQPLPWALESNEGSCTEARSGGEVWSVGGSSGTWAKFITVDDTYYLPIGEPCVQNIANLPDLPLYGEGEAGQMITYTVPLSNHGNIVDDYNLFIDDAWLGKSGPIEPGEAITVTVSIVIPADALPGVLESTFRVESLRDPGVMDTIQLFTTIIPTYVVEIAPDLIEQRGMHGELITCTLTVMNEGNITDTVILTVTENTWEVLLSAHSIELGVGESEDVWITVTVPEAALLGESDHVIITAISTGNPAITDQSQLDTTAFWYRTLLPLNLKN